MESTSDAKTALRRRLRTARAQLAATARRQQEAAIGRHLVELLGPPDHGRDLVAGYVAVGSEVRVRDALAGLARNGWSLALPRVAGDDLELVAWSADEPLDDGHHGVPEPRGDALAMADLAHRLGAVVVPGVGYDRHGGRLGQGGGHYDRLLARLEQHAVHPRLVAPAFTVQVLDRVPRATHDRLVDAVVTPTGTMERRAEP